MLKNPHSMNLEQDAVTKVQGLLREVPFVNIEGIEQEPKRQGNDYHPDFQIRVRLHNRRYNLVCEVKASGQPRYVRSAISQLRFYLNQAQPGGVGLVVAPFLSPASQKICRDEEFGFVDLQGNCRLVFDGVFIERSVPPSTSTERRELKSIFAPKSAQVLRLLLRDPRRPWKIADLAEVAGVSLGHASNVRSALIDREWAEGSPSGLILTDPNALLDSWREVYKRPPGKRLPFYTILHGSPLEEQIRSALQAANQHGNAMLASFSAAQWLAPYARAGAHYVYGDERALAALTDHLQLSSAAKGENVILLQLDDDALFRDAVEPVPGIRCTSPVQTYLDLWTAGDRGREAAEHLRAEKLKWIG
jgi:hypothetical protein